MTIGAEMKDGDRNSIYSRMLSGNRKGLWWNSGVKNARL